MYTEGMKKNYRKNSSTSIKGDIKTKKKLYIVMYI